jgi:predicted metal-binding protein
MNQDKETFTPPFHGGPFTVRIKVCVTCSRYEPRIREPTRGQILACHLEQSLAPAIHTGKLLLRRVECLSGRRHPANVELTLCEKFKLRLYDLTVYDVAPVRSVVALCASDRLSYDEIMQVPELRGHIAYLRTAVIP